MIVNEVSLYVDLVIDVQVICSMDFYFIIFIYRRSIEVVCIQNEIKRCVSFSYFYGNINYEDNRIFIKRFFELDIGDGVELLGWKSNSK